MPYFRLIVCRLLPAISTAKAVYPMLLILSMHAALSERRMKPTIFDMKLLYFLHVLWLLCVQSAQEASCCSKLQLRTLHQLALAFSWHPGHFPLR